METTKSIPVVFASTGLVLKSSPDEIPITAYKKLVNMFTDLENCLSVRNGFTRLNNGLPAPPHSSYMLRDYQGILWRYAITNSQLHVAEAPPSAGVFSAVTGAGSLSSADDPRAMFANYALYGAEIKPYAFFADGKVLLKHSGGSAPATRVGIPMPPSGLVRIDLGTPTLVAIDPIDDPTQWTPTNCTLTTGAGTQGYGGDGGPAIAAVLNYPYGVAVDASGNQFIADWANHRIRKITVSTGIITTVAGNGTAGFSGDGGAAITAKVRYPSGVAIDASGNLLIADSGNNRIRKVTPGGVITTVAGDGTAGYGGDGGQATSAQLNGPTGITVDATGNLFIADAYNSCIRKVTVAGIISTIAGDGTQGYSGDGGPATSAQLCMPYCTALDGAGNLLIADQGNNRIRKVTVSTGIITTVAGTGTAGYSGDGGQADIAEINGPTGVWVDTGGNLFIADQNNNRIRKVTPGGVITTVAGTGTAGFSGDGGPATAAELNAPTGVVVGGTGNLFIVDWGNQRLRMVAPGGVITTVAGTGIISASVEMDVTDANTLGTAYKAIDAPGTIDLDNADLDQPIQFYVQFPYQEDIDNCLQATIEFNLSVTRSDVSFETVMVGTINLTSISPGVWSLQQIPKESFTFQGVDYSLNWSNVTAVRIGLTMEPVPVANPGRGGLLMSGILWNYCNLNTDGGVSAALAEDLQWTFTYYNSLTDTESDYATPVYGSQSGVIGFTIFELNFPTCPGTAPPLANPDMIRIYRMGGTITQFQRIDEIPYTPGGAPPVYRDNTPDEELGDVLELDNQLPVDAPLGLEISDNRLWTWGGTTTDSLGNVIPEPPNRLRFSKRTRIEHFPAQNYIYVGTGSEAIQRALDFDGQLYIFTLTRVYTLAGTDINTYQAVSTAINQGLMSPFGVCRGTRQLFMYSYDGIYEFPSGTKVSEPINPLFFNETINDYPPVQKGREQEIAMAFWNSKLYFSYPRTSDTIIRNDSMLVWDVIYNRWHFYLYGAQGLFMEPETKILAGSNVTQWDAIVDGLPSDFGSAGPWVMQLENGFADVCQNGTRGIFYDMDTKDFDLGFPDQEKRFIDFVVDATTGTSSLILQALFDGTIRETLGAVQTTNRDQVIFPVLIGEGDGFLARRVALSLIGRQDSGAISSIQLYKVIHRVLLEPMKHRMFVTEWSDYGTPTPKFFRELWIELDTFGNPLDRIEVQIDQALATVIKANTMSTGRTKFYYGLPPDLRGTFARLKIVPRGNNEVKLWDHTFQTIPEPPQINAYQLPWSEEQWPYPKLWKEVLFDVDTNNSTIDFDFWLDGTIRQSFSIRTEGRRLITKSLDRDLFGKLGRITVDEDFLDPFCCLPVGVRVYSVRYVIDKDPADVTFSDSYEQLMSYDRTKIIRRFWLAMKNPDADVTMNLYVDDLLASTKVIPMDARRTGHNKKRVDLESDIEGRLIRVFFSSPFPFQLYWEKSEIEYKGTNPDDGYGRYKLAAPQTL